MAWKCLEDCLGVLVLREPPLSNVNLCSSFIVPAIQRVDGEEWSSARAVLLSGSGIFCGFFERKTKNTLREQNRSKPENEG
jgi:hypothetical protein